VPPLEEVEEESKGCDVGDVARDQWVIHGVHGGNGSPARQGYARAAAAREVEET
jgi:hypothetical protein